MDVQAITPAGRGERTLSVSSFLLLCLACAGVGILLAVARPSMAVKIAGALLCAYIAFTRPFAGLVLYLIIEYTRPGEVMPSIAEWRPALIVAVITGAGWMRARSRDRSEGFVWAGQTWTLVGLVLTMLLSIATAVWKSEAVKVTIDASKVWIVYFLITNLVNTPRRLRQFLWAMIGLGAFLGLRSVIVYRNTGDFATGPGSGFLGDRNDLAMAMAVILPIAGALIQSSIKPAHRALAGTAVVALIAGIICTFSRGGFVALTCVLFGMGLTARRKVTALLTLAGLLGVAWLAAPVSYKARILSITEYHQDESAQNRLYAWRAARAMYHDRPFFGVGPGSFQTAYGRFYRPSEAPMIWRAPHSIYFECMAELGLSGCVFFGLLVLLTYRDLANVYFRRVPGEVRDWERYYAAGLAVGLTGYLAGATFLSALLYSHPYYLAALTVSLMNIRRRATEPGGEWA